MAMFLLVALVVFLFFFGTAILKRNEIKYMNKDLPPGNMGWPFLGKTREFLKQGPSFMKNQRARFGSFFKSHILGHPTVVSMDPDQNRYILMNEAKGLVPGYPKSTLEILGKWNIAAVNGTTHKYMRGAFLAMLNPSVIRTHLLPKIDDFMRRHLSNLDGTVIDIQRKTKELVLLSSMNQVAGDDLVSISNEFMPVFFSLVLGTLSLPLNFPGSKYRKGLKARKDMVRMLRKVVEKRRASNATYNDMLDIAINGEYKLNDEQIVDQMITVLYSGYETVSVTSMMAIKYLHDHPNVLQQLREEHLAIRKGKRPEDPLGWEDCKSMSFTRAVIFETSRLATVVNGVLRKTTKDMELTGSFIPKGWRIYVYIREINYDECLYPDPYTFNPSRWLDKNSESQNYNFLFGGGTRLCPGKELGITEISTFLHYFVTKYRWEEVGGDKILKFPRVQAPNGLRIRLSSYDKN